MCLSKSREERFEDLVFTHSPFLIFTSALFYELSRLVYFPDVGREGLGLQVLHYLLSQSGPHFRYRLLASNFVAVVGVHQHVCGNDLLVFWCYGVLPRWYGVVEF